MVIVAINPTQTSPQIAALPERTNHTLLKVIRDNFSTQYASKAASLAGFRDAVSAHGGIEDDDTLLADFRAHVPFSDYDSYKPFIDKFNAQPCKEEDVENMFAPGLPDLLALSSGTSGMSPKVYPKYDHNARLKLPTRPFFDPNNKHPLAALVCTGYSDVKIVERAPGEVVQKIPVSPILGGGTRRTLGWYIDDDSRLSSSMSGYAVPWAATVIVYFPSFLIVHGLFFLARRDVDRFYVPFATQFIDLMSHINEHWDLLVSCIRDGTLPDLKGIDHVRKYLQAHFRPNPERATELLEIGPPFASKGWFPRVWPNASQLLTVCSGPFATVLPKVRSILGPNVPIRSTGFGSTEAMIGFPRDADALDEFVLRGDHGVEFLDVSLDATHKNLSQMWEVEVGKSYELIVTTRDELWRFRQGDIIHIIGFDSASNAPIFKYAGRRSLMIHLQSTQITEDQLLAANQVFSSEDTVPVQEFTTVRDDRALLPTIGFLVELAGPLGSNAHLAIQKLFDALATTNSELSHILELGQIRLPTIRIVKAGTFGEYRQWKGETANITSGQIKVPVILTNPTVQEWFLERVVQEL